MSGCATLILGQGEIAALMRPEDYLAAVEMAFRMVHEGRACSAVPMHLPGRGGGFHAKGATFDADRRYVALKLNGNFPGNPDRTGLPTVQGVILLCDGETGAVLAIMDSIEVTLRRTAAATALAARHLARADAETLLVCGCGAQGHAHVEALAGVLPIRLVLTWDIDPARARRFAEDTGHRLRLACATAPDASVAARRSDVIVTCTIARFPILGAADCAPGAFIAAVGADNPEKNEIAPELFGLARIVVDDLDQCAAMGDLHHAIIAGTATPSSVHGDLGEVVAGAKAGRETSEEVILFDSTGVAIQDAASAVQIYERAKACGVGQAIALGDRPCSSLKRSFGEGDRA